MIKNKKCGEIFSRVIYLYKEGDFTDQFYRF